LIQNDLRWFQNPPVNNRVGSSPTPGTIIKTLFGQQVNVANAALCLLSTAVENQNFVQFRAKGFNHGKHSKNHR
jgi:hypothetical protein